RHGCALVLMHNQDGTEYPGDLMEEINRFLAEAAARGVAAGVPKEKVIVDPGIGFGKTADQSWEVMRRFAELKEIGHPILIGTSRKSFIGNLLDLPVSDRLEVTAATVVAAVLRAVKACEHEGGRRPTRTWGPRVIDGDFLLFGDQRVRERDLVIPHPRISGREFVLEPLAELGVKPVERW